MTETRDPTKLRKRVQWLRRREIELRSRVIGPRYDPPDITNTRFIGHVGDWDGYLIDELTNCKIWLVKKVERSIVARDVAQQYPDKYPLHNAVLQLAVERAAETDLVSATMLNDEA